MEKINSAKKITCPKCDLEDIKQVGITPNKYIFKCNNLDCKTFWSEPK